MNFEFPDDDQYVELALINSVEELKQVLNSYKEHYHKNVGIAFYYEIRNWIQKGKVQKLGAYCKYCNNVKILYSRTNPNDPFELQQLFSSHRNHPGMEEYKLKIHEESSPKAHKSPTLNPQKPPQRKNRFSGVMSQNFVLNLYKEYIFEWLNQYEKNVRKMLAQKFHSDAPENIDSYVLRNSVKVKKGGIQECSERDIFLRGNLWNEMVTEILESEGFAIERFLRHYYVDDYDFQQNFANCLIVNDTFNSQKQSSTTYLIRRTIKIDAQPNFSHLSEVSQINCLIAFTYNLEKDLRLLWMAFAQKAPEALNEKPEELKEVLNILEVLLEVEQIQTFHDGIVFIENDDMLMSAFTMLFQVIQEKNRESSHNVCLHPLIIDKLIMKEDISSVAKRNLRQLIRCRTSNQKTQVLEKSSKLSDKDRFFINNLFTIDNFFLLSEMPHLDPSNVIEFLPEEFYIKSNLKNMFSKISGIFQIKNSITLNELPVLILSIFMSLWEHKQEETEVEKDQWKQFSKFIHNSQEKHIYQNWIKIIQKPHYEMKNIVNSCSRLILQLLYMNIYKSFCGVEIQKISFQQVQNLQAAKVRDKTFRSFKVKFDSEAYKNSEDRQKLWNCDCQNYKLYGVPCEHQILCALTFETSLFKEISQKVRTPQKIVDRPDKTHLVTNCLKKILFS